MSKRRRKVTPALPLKVQTLFVLTKMTDSFVFYRSFYEAVKELTDSDRLAVYEAIMHYALNDKEPKAGGIVAAMFTLIRPNLDANKNKRINGMKGGRPKKEDAENNLSETKPKPNTNQTKTKHEPNGDGDGDVNGDDDCKMKKKNEDVEIYRAFAKLSLTVAEKDKLLSEGFTQQEIDDTLDAIENYTGNHKYKSLLLTCRTWIRKDRKQNAPKQPQQITTPSGVQLTDEMIAAADRYGNIPLRKDEATRRTLMYNMNQQKEFWASDWN